MKVGIPRETAPGERRTAVTPDVVKRYVKKGWEVVFEPGAGSGSAISDADLGSAGATSCLTAFDTNVVLKVQKPSLEEVGKLRENGILVSFLYPLANLDLVRSLATRKVTAIAVDMLPRTTLAQSMDALSSQANLAGYWAVLAAAYHLPKIFPMLMTAAGTITPAKVLVMGTGVAGLQAIGTAKRLGAIVEATDVRPETKEQVESLGGKFLQVTGVEIKTGQGGYAAEQSEEYKRKQAELISGAIAKADAVITTALIPGRNAPVLVTEAQVKSMRPGSVIVDLAAEQGGNVEGCEAGQIVVKHGVTIVGLTNVPSRVASHATQAYAKNLENLMNHLSNKDGSLKIDLNDEITKGGVITREGQIVHPKVKEVAGGA